MRSPGEEGLGAVQGGELEHGIHSSDVRVIIHDEVDVAIGDDHVGDGDDIGDDEDIAALTVTGVDGQLAEMLRMFGQSVSLINGNNRSSIDGGMLQLLDEKLIVGSHVEVNGFNDAGQQVDVDVAPGIDIPVGIVGSVEFFENHVELLCEAVLVEEIGCFDREAGSCVTGVTEDLAHDVKIMDGGQDTDVLIGDGSPAQLTGRVTADSMEFIPGELAHESIKLVPAEVLQNFNGQVAVVDRGIHFDDISGGFRNFVIDSRGGVVQRDMILLVGAGGAGAECEKHGQRDKQSDKLFHDHQFSSYYTIFNVIWFAFSEC